MKAWWALSLMVGFAMPMRMAFAIDYDRDIKPLFSQKCGACHGALKQESGLRLDAGVLIRKGSDEGPVIVPGKAAESSLLTRVTSEDADERIQFWKDRLGGASDKGELKVIRLELLRTHGLRPPDEDMAELDSDTEWSDKTHVLAPGNVKLKRKHMLSHAAALLDYGCVPLGAPRGALHWPRVQLPG